MFRGLNVFYGFYLLLTLGCTFYVLRKWIGKYHSFGEERWGQRGNTILSLAAIAALYWFQDTYRHTYSREAYAMQMFERVLSRWEAEKPAMITEMDMLASSIRPWDAEDSYEEGY